MVSEKFAGESQSSIRDARRSVSFLVRCWVEGGGGGQDIRGTMYNLATGAHVHFADPARLGDQLMRELGVNCTENLRDARDVGNADGGVTLKGQEGRDGREGGLGS